MSLDTSILGEEVALKHVDKAVRALWADETAGKTRASLMNFGIYGEDAAALERNTQLLGNITREHSCRALLIHNNPSESTPSARAWVTAHCQLYDGKRSVCCEQLSFVLEGGQADEIRNLLFSHVESDLPLVLWWQGELSGRLDERLYSVLDGLIVDSSQWKKPVESFQRLLSARESRTARFTLGDLSWMRSHVMRLTLASAFQNGVLRATLPQMNSLRVVHAPGNATGALLLAAWIGTQLKARLKLNGKRLFFVRQDAAELEVTLAEGVADGCPLQCMELKGPESSVSIQRKTGCGFVQARSERHGTVDESVQPAPKDDDAELIVDQLSRFGGSTRYFETLPLFMQMAEATLS
jgi:glucose-6-phosphate dehydrogenase assembly protein OpcA